MHVCMCVCKQCSGDSGKGGGGGTYIYMYTLLTFAPFAVDIYNRSFVRVFMRTKLLKESHEGATRLLWTRCLFCKRQRIDLHAAKRAQTSDVGSGYFTDVFVLTALVGCASTEFAKFMPRISVYRRGFSRCHKTGVFQDVYFAIKTFEIINIRIKTISALYEHLPSLFRATPHNSLHPTIHYNAKKINKIECTYSSNTRVLLKNSYPQFCIIISNGRALHLSRCWPNASPSSIVYLMRGGDKLFIIFTVTAGSAINSYENRLCIIKHIPRRTHIHDNMNLTLECY